MQQQSSGPLYSRTMTERVVAHYNQNPHLYKDEAIAIIEKHANFYQIPFQKNQQASLLSVVKEAGKGYIEGFTTIPAGGDIPTNAADRIARSIGNLAGFVGFVPLPSVGKLAAIKKAISGNSLPLYAAKKATEALSPLAKGVAAKLAEGKAGAAATASKFLLSEVPASTIEGAFNLGAASAVSAWSGGVDAIMEAFVHGAEAGSVFRLIGAVIPKGGPRSLLEGVKPTEQQVQDKLLMAIAGSAYTGLPSTLRGDTTPEQVYEYLLGAWFGANERSPKEHKRNRFLEEAFKRGDLFGEQSYLHPEQIEGFKELDPTTQKYIADELALRVGVAGGLVDATTGVVDFKYPRRAAETRAEEPVNYIQGVSGGAKGADTEFAFKAAEYQDTERPIQFSNIGFQGGTDFATGKDYQARSASSKAPGLWLEELETRNPKEWQEAQKEVEIVTAQMGRKLSSTEYGRKNNIRNYFQARFGNTIFAVSEFDPKNPNQIKGGTGLTVEMAKRMQKPIYFMNQEDYVAPTGEQRRHGWYEWNYEKNAWEYAKELPKITGTFAGIGTRELNRYGTSQIHDLYRRSFGKSSADLLRETEQAKNTVELTDQVGNEVLDAELNRQRSDAETIIEAVKESLEGGSEAIKPVAPTTAIPKQPEPAVESVTQTAKTAPVETRKFITRDDLRKEPDKIFLFGDNLEQRGLGGQAKEMRGEPNSIGIPTKKKPSNTPDSFFTDAELESNKAAIDAAFAKIPVGKTVVIPEDGLGTGLADLPNKAPLTFEYLKSKLRELSLVAKTETPKPTELPTEPPKIPEAEKKAKVEKIEETTIEKGVDRTPTIAGRTYNFASKLLDESLTSPKTIQLAKWIEQRFVSDRDFPTGTLEPEKDLAKLIYQKSGIQVDEAGLRELRSWYLRLRLSSIPQYSIRGITKTIEGGTELIIETPKPLTTGINAVGNRKEIQIDSPILENVYINAAKALGKEPESAPMVVLDHAVIGNKEYPLQKLWELNRSFGKYLGNTKQVEAIVKHFESLGYYYYSGKNDQEAMYFMRYHPLTNVPDAPKAMFEALYNRIASNSDYAVFMQNIDSKYRKQFVSNLLYTMEANGFVIDYTKPTEIDFTILLDKKNDFIRSALDFNKRMQIWRTNGIVTDPEYIEKDIKDLAINDEGYKSVNFILVEDDIANSKAWTDGGALLRNDVNFSLGNFLGMSKTGQVKAFIVSPNAKLGALLGKFEFHVPPAEFSDWMRRESIHIVLPRSTAKQMGLREMSSYEYKDGQLRLGQHKIYQLPIKDIKGLLSQKQDKHNLMDQRLLKQMIMNLSPESMVPMDRAVIKDMVDHFIDGAVNGDKYYTDLANEWYANPTDVKLRKEVLDNLDSVGLETVSRLMQDRRFADIILTKITNRNEEFAAEVFEETYFIEKADPNYKSILERLMSVTKPTIATFTMKHTREYVQSAVRNYFVNRILRPTVPNSGVAVMQPWDKMTYERLQPKEGQFWLGEAFREARYNVEPLEIADKDGVQINRISLGELWNKFGYQPKVQEFFKAMTVRVPMASASGAQEVKFMGFSGLHGHGVLMHEKMVQKLGGADFDADKAYFFFGWPAEWRKMYSDNAKENEDANGKFVDPVTPEMQNLITIHGVKKPTDNPFLTYLPNERMRVSEAAYDGRANLGKWVRLRTILLQSYGVAKEGKPWTFTYGRGEKAVTITVTPKKSTGKFHQISGAAIQLAADSAKYEGLKTYGEIGWKMVEELYDVKGFSDKTLASSKLSAFMKAETGPVGVVNRAEKMMWGRDPDNENRAFSYDKQKAGTTKATEVLPDWNPIQRVSRAMSSIDYQVGLVSKTPLEKILAYFYEPAKTLKEQFPDAIKALGHRYVTLTDKSFVSAYNEAMRTGDWTKAEDFYFNDVATMVTIKAVDRALGEGVSKEAVQRILEKIDSVKDAIIGARKKARIATRQQAEGEYIPDYASVEDISADLLSWKETLTDPEKNLADAFYLGTIKFTSPELTNYALHLMGKRKTDKLTELEFNQLEELRNELSETANIRAGFISRAVSDQSVAEYMKETNAIVNELVIDNPLPSKIETEEVLKQVRTPYAGVEKDSPSKPTEEGKSTVEKPKVYIQEDPWEAVRDLWSKRKTPIQEHQKPVFEKLKEHLQYYQHSIAGHFPEIVREITMKIHGRPLELNELTYDDVVVIERYFRGMRDGTMLQRFFGEIGKPHGPEISWWDWFLFPERTAEKLKSYDFKLIVKEGEFQTQSGLWKKYKYAIPTTIQDRLITATAAASEMSIAQIEQERIELSSKFNFAKDLPDAEGLFSTAYAAIDKLHIESLRTSLEARLAQIGDVKAKDDPILAAERDRILEIYKRLPEIEQFYYQKRLEVWNKYQSRKLQHKRYNVQIDGKFVSMTGFEIIKRITDETVVQNKKYFRYIKGDPKKLEHLYARNKDGSINYWEDHFPNLQTTVKTPRFKRNAVLKEIGDALKLGGTRISMDYGVEGLSAIGRDIVVQEIYEKHGSEEAAKYLLTHPVQVTKENLNFYPHYSDDARSNLKSLEEQYKKLLADTSIDPKVRAQKAQEKILRIQALGGGYLTDIEDQWQEHYEVLEAIAARKAKKFVQSYEAPVYKFGHMQHRQEGMLDWKYDLAVYDRYASQLVKSYYSQLSQIVTNIRIKEFENDHIKEWEHDLTKAWVTFFQIYARDALGHAVIIPERVLNNPNMNLKGTPYSWFADSRTREIINKVAINLGIGDSKLPDILRGLSINEIRAFANLEGKWELAALLSHPKTPIANAMGGTTNTVINVGLDAFMKAGNIKELQKINSNWKSMDDVDKWVVSKGVIEEFLISEGALQVVPKSSNWKRFVEDAAQLVKKDPAVKDETLHSLAKKYGITDDIWEKGGFFMRWSERKIRSRSFMAHVVHARELYGDAITDVNHPFIIEMAKKGVKATQFLYTAPYRPAWTRTAVGQVLSRFQLWSWNSVRFANDLARDAKIYGFQPGSPEYDRLRRYSQASMMVLALANIFPYSLFKANLPAPWNWFQDLVDWLFGDETERNRAFFGAWPSEVAPLQMITPPALRVLPVALNGFLSQDYTKLADYTIWTMFPFGRIARDLVGPGNIIENPIRTVEKLTGFPYIKLNQKQNELEDNPRTMVLPRGIL